MLLSSIWANFSCQLSTERAPPWLPLLPGVVTLDIFLNMIVLLIARAFDIYPRVRRFRRINPVGERYIVSVAPIMFEDQDPAESKLICTSSVRLYSGYP